MVGFRKPSVKKSFSARTTGRINRSVKRATNPFYGKKGTGFVRDPERSIKNAVYHRTTTGGLSSMKRSKVKNDEEPNSSFDAFMDLIEAVGGLLGILLELAFVIFIGWLFFSIF